MRRRSSEVAVGAAVLLGLAVVVFGTIWLKGAKLGSEDIDVKARFREVGQLLEGSTVKTRGVPIGRVEKIELEPSGAGVVITMSIDSEVRLPSEAVVILAPESMFGDWQAEIVQRSQFRLYPYAEPNEPNMLPGYALPDMSRLTAVADEIAQNLATLTSRVEIAFTQETAENVAEVIRNVQEVSAQLTTLVDKQQVAIAEVAANLEQTSEAAGQAAETMRRTFAEVETAISNGRLTTIMGNVERASARTDSLTAELVAASRELRRVAGGADTTFRRIGAIAGGVERGEGSLGLLLRDSALYYRLTEGSVQLQALLKDIRENPRKYINLTVF